MSLIENRAVIEKVFNDLGYYYNVDEKVTKSGTHYLCYSLVFCDDINQKSVDDYSYFVFIDEFGICRLYISFDNCICPKEKIRDLCYLICELNDCVRYHWEIDLESGEVSYNYTFIFDARYFEGLFKVLKDEFRNDFARILAVCGSSNSTINPMNNNSTDTIRFKL